MNKNKTKNSTPLSCWIITEGMIGTQNQCVGVAESLGLMMKLETTIMQINLRQPWKSLSPWLGFEVPYSFIPSLTPPWPDLLIAAGRKSIATSRYIKKQSMGKTFTVQLQDPKTSPQRFDLLAVPFHDKMRGENVIVTNGAPNRMTKEQMTKARTQFAPLFSPFKAPRVAVLIGGDSRTHKLTPTIMRQLATQLKQLDASLMITTSRRTGDENIKILKSGLKDTNAYIWDGTGENPYFGMLGWADHILVTSDSVSMLSDAGTTGKPVHMIPLEGRSPRFDKLYNHLQKIGVIRLFNGNLESWSYEPLNDAQMIAQEIERRLGKT